MGKLKIVYPICCGMDVHRDFLIACITATNAKWVTEYQSRRFSTYTGTIAIARRLLTAIYHILSNNEPYNPSACAKEDRPPVDREISQEKAFEMLARMGYIILVPSVLPLPR